MASAPPGKAVGPQAGPGARHENTESTVAPLPSIGAGCMSVPQGAAWRRARSARRDLNRGWVDRHQIQTCVRRYRDPVLPLPTSRLRFREMTDSDLPDIATLDIGGSRGPAGWIAWNRRNYEEHGFGLWVVETHAGRFVGDCGLTMQKVEEEWFVEAGWHVRSDLRGQGYATEAAAAVREAARAAGIQRLIAIIRPDNTPSRCVATKIGLDLGREVDKSGGPALVFGADLQT